MPPLPVGLLAPKGLYDFFVGGGGADSVAFALPSSVAGGDGGDVLAAAVTGAAGFGAFFGTDDEAIISM